MKRTGEASIKMFKPVDGRALVVAADGIVGLPDWLLVLSFEVGAGETNLIAHTVLRRPAVWPQPPNLDAGLLSDYAAVVWGSMGGGAHLTTAIVRSASTTDLEMFVRRHIVARVHATSGAEMAWGDDVSPGTPEKRTGPRAAGDLRRAQLARRYVELLGESATPKKDLAAELHLSLNTVNSYLHQARERGLLTSVGQGRAGGELTALAYEYLAADTETTEES